MTTIFHERLAEAAKAHERLAAGHVLGTVHNTTKLLAVEHQKIPFRPKPYPVDASNPFYRYDPDQCILCGRCVEACQNVQMNETLSIRWEDPHPRVLWDGANYHRQEAATGVDQRDNTKDKQ
jgi:predicted molibdopterin-dependent oxidoreductase YjgC